ncbi:hypothetical protein QTP70_008489 [Hemibagrus guttatus]|uniref:ribonuclease H n=1 Tax=Hemibagrus guttatus TaxID=175788 RepID=A0AAE0V5T7_9TELE|nr:hypothetical protein QTP70_008489 [Hemibagrus guttatus]
MHYEKEASWQRQCHALGNVLLGILGYTFSLTRYFLMAVASFSRSQSNRASVGCARQTSPIHGGPTSQLTGLKGSAASILVPDTTAHNQGSSGIHASTGDEEVMGKFGVKERILEGQIVVDFAKRMDMAVVNTYFQKREEHRVTYKSGAEVIGVTERKVLGVSYGRRKEDKEAWWWNEEVQDSIQRKSLAKKKWDLDRTEENRQEYKELQRRVKREVSKAKQKAYDELYTRLDTREGQKDLYRLARQRDRDEKDVQQVRVIKDRDGRVLTSQTEEFKVEVGLHHGLEMSPFMFAMVVDQLSEELRQESPCTILFADDIVICIESREQVEENLERTQKCSFAGGAKTRVRAPSGSLTPGVSWEGDPLPGTPSGVLRQTPNSTMAKTKELSKDTRNKIVDLHQAGKTKSAIEITLAKRENEKVMDLEAEEMIEWKTNINLLSNLSSSSVGSDHKGQPSLTTLQIITVASLDHF